MYGSVRSYSQLVKLLLLFFLFLSPLQTAQAETKPQNGYGLTVDYAGSAAAGTLKVKLKDAILRGGLAGVRIVAHEIRPDGSAYWAGARTTDSNGRAEFTLQRLGNGGRYYLKAFVWHGQPVYTETLMASGTIVWKVGRVRVRVKNATLSVPTALAGYDVTLRRRDGGWGRRLTTDNEGVVRMDPPGVDSGILYELAAISPLGGDRETSDVINAAGTYTFEVGNRPLLVTLRKVHSNTALAGKRLVAWERRSDGRDVWAAAGTTDDAGKVVFELDKLGRGGRYFLRADPFGVRRLDSEILTETGEYTFRVGNTPVGLVDEATGKGLAGRKLVAFTVAADKSHTWYASGYTNGAGRVFFDFPEISGGAVFGVRADDPFANGEQFFSALIREQGPVELRVEEGRAEKPDRVDPLVGIVSPVPGKGAAAVGGFLLRGRASDDRKLDRVIVEIRSGGKQQQAEALYNPNDESWVVHVSADMLVAGSRARITATAIDTTNNQQVSSVSYRVINDTQAPVITVFSPKDGAVVSRDGFTLRGKVVDDVAVSLLRVSVEDLNGRQLIPSEVVTPLAGEKRWAHNFFPLRWPRREAARLVVFAEDERGNRQELAVGVTPAWSGRNHRRMIDRVTFGATDTLVQLSRAVGWRDLLEMQLAPEQIDDSALEGMLGPASSMTMQNLAWRTLLRMLYSERQLLELMTWFWDNHFNTRVPYGRATWEYRENEAFRRHALGRFRDLLEVSAKSPAMLKFLDNARNHKRSPNENYARELLELHTVGLDGGYTQRDIDELARVFTGWHMDNERFYFNAAAHDGGDKQFLGAVIRGGGVEEGEQVLDILASHPSTARFICEKLVRFFVADQPDPGLASACARTFVNTHGDIRAVLRKILKSKPFYEATADNTRFKSPLRYTTGILRALDVPAERNIVMNALPRMGMRIYRNPVPTGWPVSGDSWINEDQLVQRVNLLADLFADLENTGGFSLLDAARERNAVTGAGILGMFMDRFFARRMTYREYRESLFALNGPRQFSIDAVDAEDRLRQTLRTMLAFPASHVF